MRISTAEDRRGSGIAKLRPEGNLDSQRFRAEIAPQGGREGEGLSALSILACNAKKLSLDSYLPPGFRKVLLELF